MSRILMLDGDPDVVEAGRTILQREGFTVAMAPNLEGAFALIPHFRPDLLFIDVMQRTFADGERMAAAACASGLNVPILVLTSLERTLEFFTYREGTMAPVGEFAERPMEPAALVKNVRHLLGLPK